LIESWLSLSLNVRLAILVGGGLLLGALANWGIYTFAYFARPISPWGRPSPDAPPRRWFDRLPVIGWFGLRRERSIHGTGFWIRPLLIELAFPLVVCQLYLFESIEWGVLEPRIAVQLQMYPQNIAGFNHWMNYLFLGHLVLLTLMTIATFIDFDEQTVPDFVTVPGTFMGLALAAINYELLLPYLMILPMQQVIEPMVLTAPRPWDPWWETGTGGLVGIALFTGWCFAIGDRRIIMRRGWKKAVEYFFYRFLGKNNWKILLLIWLLGTSGIIATWFWGGLHWRGLISSLMGMAVGGGSVWAVRIVASRAMGQEAMGFGDVTLMAMIGSFIGWQPALLAFALAPMTSIVIVIIQFALTRNRVVAFGPYLCAGTAVTILFWPQLWDYFGIVAFGLAPSILGGILVSLLLIMGAMLFIWRWIRFRLLGF
jgi:prepilin signal peptidase PulO-like enzyme (type II secretory pathway)